MDINLTAEALLTQLGYSKTEQSIQQMEKTIKNTKGFKHFSKHLLSLHDQLAHLKGFVALSNSKDVIKIKRSEAISKEMEDEFTNLVEGWAKKYKVQIEQVANKPTYYIIGQ